MKKLIVLLAVCVCLIIPNGSQAYMINDPFNDSIGFPTYESYGINVLNYFGPGGMTFQLFTNYPKSGDTVYGSPPWTTQVADIFIKETWKGNDYLWALPVVTHTEDGYTFKAGTLYAVGSYFISDDLDPSHGTGYNYNHNIPVLIKTIGENNGFASLGTGTSTYLGQSGMPAWEVTISTGFYQDDPNGTFDIVWGTATCANDVVQGRIPTPEPTALLLIGAGLLGLAVSRRKFRKA